VRVGRIVLVVFGVLTLIVGLALAGAGGALVWANATQRDASGFFHTSTEAFSTTGVALVSSVDFTMHPGANSWVTYDPLGTVRVRASVDGANAFVGVASTGAVDAYLAGVAHSRVTSVSVLPFVAHYSVLSGASRAASPLAQTFWVASASGPGVQQVTWKPVDGRWSLVVMRSDAQAGLVAHVSVGTNTGLVGPVGIGLAAGGLIVLLLGGMMVGFGVIGLRRREPLANEAGREVTPPSLGADIAPGAYPVRLDGRLDAPISRWRWIFKWLFVIPHLIVLAFLWLAVMALTVVAGISILFTGRYPKSIFDFVVGVIRWTWRVAFYSYSALGTDVYPPFSLEPDDRFPADFAVSYPEHLSRGLVLVKWWLLAIPQYLIVGFFTSGGIAMSGRVTHSWWLGAGGGAIGLIVAVAALVLLFTGRYPETLFDFTMGMNRWCYRVLSYVLLLRDEYPPFRFDAGGADPGRVVDVVPPTSPMPPVASVTTTSSTDDEVTSP
jgi:Domain of unknown function (DUF4389)